MPIYEDGQFVDLLLISDDMSFGMVTHRTPWLGRENISGAVCLHQHPMDWIEAGGTGCCHVGLISRQALKELRNADSIVCNDIETALEAWSWAFEADEGELSRFEIDNTPDAVSAYYERAVRWHAWRVAADVERTVRG